MTPKKVDSIISRSIALGMCGLSVGWMMGLTVTTNVQHVISVLMTLIIGVLSLLAGLKPTTSIDEKLTVSPMDKAPADSYGEVAESKKSAGEGQMNLLRQLAIESLWPVAGFMIGIMAGTTLGVLTRTNNLLGPNTYILNTFWELDSTQKKQLSNRLIEKSFQFNMDTGRGGQSEYIDIAPNPSLGILFKTEMVNYLCQSNDKGVKMQARLKDALEKLIQQAKNKEHKDSLKVLKTKLAHSPAITIAQIKDKLCSASSR